VVAGVLSSTLMFASCGSWSIIFYINLFASCGSWSIISFQHYKLSTCLHVGIVIVPLFCIAWGEVDGCTVVLKGGTISMPTGSHLDNVFIPGLKTTTDF
jgi:hypothetical protein